MGVETKYAKNLIKNRPAGAARAGMRARIERINDMADKETARRAGIEEAYDRAVRQPNEEEYSPRGSSERRYEDGGKVQRKSDRRKEEGLDTEIVVTPKKYRKGGKAC